MKRTVQLLTFMLCGAMATTQAQTRIGVKAGFNNAYLSTEQNEFTQRRAGWHAGLVADMSISDNFSIQPQLLLSNKGYRTKDITLTTPAGQVTVPSVSYRFTYLELPVNIIFKPKVGSGRLLVGAGPYVAMAIGGKAGDEKIKFDGKKSSEAGDGKMHAKRFDLGANALLGYELKNGLFFNLNYSRGFSNVYADGKSKNNYFGLSVGYLFN